MMENNNLYYYSGGTLLGSEFSGQIYFSSSPRIGIIVLFIEAILSTLKDLFRTLKDLFSTLKDLFSTTLKDHTLYLKPGPS